MLHLKNPKEKDRTVYLSLPGMRNVSQNSEDRKRPLEV